MSDKLEDILVGLSARIAEVERRAANRSRVGTVTDVNYDTGEYRVELRPDSPSGEPFKTPWIPRRENSMGRIKIHSPLSIGEQVKVTSESGDLVDAAIDGAIPSSANQKPHNKGGEYVIEIDGQTRITITGDKMTISAPSEINFTAQKIVLDGVCHLGGEGGGSLVHRKGDKDSAGDVAREAATRVYAK